jgi:hypothetical protein
MAQPQQQAQQQQSRPGQMTAVMRAVAATGPKVLRIGLVRGGRVLEERVIKQRTDVTIGPSEKSMFVLAHRGLPASFKLFELVQGEYVLNFLDDMGGRVALPTGISDLQMLKGQTRRGNDGSYQLRLTEDSRGKVVVGDTTLLFQFVAPPPVQPKPQLPVAVLRGATGIDWRTTIIAAFAFLVHFLAIGAMYSDWLDPVVDEELSLAGLVDTFDKLPPPPPVEEKVEEVEDAKTEEVADTPKEPVKSASPGKGGGPDKGSGGAMSSAEVAALSNELDQLSMLTLGALAASGPATAGVLQSGDVPTGALDAAAASNAGVGVGGGLKLGSGGGAIRPGQGGSLGSIGTTGKGAGTGTGSVQQVKGPQGNANVSSSVSVGSVSNAQSVIAGMRAGFRRCYQQALDQNPDIQGSIKLTIRVGPGGEVSGVSSSTTGNLPPSVVSCVQARARAGQFAPPDGGSAVVQAPVTFVKQ